MKDFAKLLAASAFILLILLKVFPYLWTDEAGTIRTLEAAGYSDIEITGWRPFMKGQDDWYSTGFRATGPGGQEVTGAVTGGFLKGNTIRTD